MPALTLPAARRASLRAFWLLQSVALGLVVAASGHRLGGPRPVLLGCTAAVLAALPGWRWPAAAARPYALWNRCAGAYARAARFLLLRICYYLIFAIAGLAGSGLRIDRNRTSHWIPRVTIANNAYSSQFDWECRASGSWTRDYCGWTSRSGQLWALGLLPFLICIAALETGKSREYTGSIYTLF